MAVLSLAAILLPIASTARGQGSFSNGPGSPATPGSGEAEANAANIASLMDAAVDAAGNVYLADSAKNTISKTAPNGTVTTLAGSENVGGSADGTGGNAQFNGPQAVAVDASGNVYVADAGNHTIRKITFAGVVTTLAGSAGQPGNADGTGADARFSSPQGVAVDARGNVYVADSKNNSIRRITAFGAVTTLAGAGIPGCADGTGIEARFFSPTRVALDRNGTLYVTDSGNHVIRKVSASGVATTLAGALVRQPRGGAIGGYADGTGDAARFNCPEAIVVDASGDLFIADSGNKRIRKVTSSGVVTTLDGTFSPRGHEQFSDRRFRGQFKRGEDLRLSERFERPSGNYIAGGLPSPGDFDVRFGQQIPPQNFGPPITRGAFVVRESGEHRRSRGKHERGEVGSSR